ncbi:hypothetical protein [Paraburkholderia sp. BCC1876]|uniref:hypothetical protein n=1 Tax=Paraburkholderia sp. BCC1876 TaxID=2676303 RepID=UPI0015911F2B|nr:hypothetical protein [Paraburkholderia sp. BCC1876]
MQLSIHFLIVKCLPWLLSLMSLSCAWLAGNGSKRAWQIGIAAQSLWAVYAVYTQAWGLLPTFAALGFIYTRNLLKAKP